MTHEEILKFLSQFIDTFRNEYDKLNENERNFFRGYIDLSVPCQIDIFLLDSPFKFQLIIISHDTGGKDKEIVIGGPFKPQEFLSRLEDFINKDEKWKRNLPKGSPIKSIDGTEISYGDILIGSLGNYFRSMNNLLFIDIKNNELHQIPIMFIDISANMLFGETKDFDYVKYLENNIKLSKQFASAAAGSNKPIVVKVPPPKPGTKGGAFIFSGTNAPSDTGGYGVMFYPPVWIGNRPKRKLPDVVLKQPLFRKKEFDIPFNDKKLIFINDGFIGVNCTDKDEAMRIFNTFFGISHLFGIFCFSVNKDDLAEIKIDQTNLEIRETTMQGHSERMQLMHWNNLSEGNLRTKVIKRETIFKVVELASKIITDNIAVNELTFLLEGYTYFINSEYSQSFIMNWLIIEKFFSNKWDELLKDKNIEGNRKRDFKDADKWDAYHKLELLNFIGYIDNDTYSLLRDFNTKRNHLVHRGEQISREDAEKLYKLAFSIVANSLGLKT